MRVLWCVLAVCVLAGCSTVKGWVNEQFSKDEEGISALGAIGKMEKAPAGPLFSGDGGLAIRLAVLAPEAQGDVPPYLPLYVQGLLNNNFRKYSRMTLVDRQNLDVIIAQQNIALDGLFSDRDFVTIGNLTNAEFFLIGVIQKLSGDRFSLLLSVTGAGTGETMAYSAKSGTLAELEGSGAVINEISADLLEQLGVDLTEFGRGELLAGDVQAVKAETGLAMGITAQEGGSDVEALFNYTRAITFDPSQKETISRLSLLSSTISEGSISEKIVSDIMARNKWLDAFKEAASFYAKHPPFEISFDPNLVQVGVTNYVNNTADLGMRIALLPSEGGFAALNALMEGLENTGRREVWGFSGWPLFDTSPRTAGTLVFEGKRSFTYNVKTVLLNNKNKVLGRNSVILKTSTIEFSKGDARIIAPDGSVETVLFSGVKADDLTPILTIVIESVNGISSREINATDYMRIYTADLEEKARVAEAALSEAEREAARIRAQADAAADEVAAARRRADNLKAAEYEAKGKEWWNNTVAKSKRGAFNLAAFLQFTRTDSFDSQPVLTPAHSSDSEAGIGTGFGFGLEIGSYFSFVPLTSFGLEVKGGIFDHYFFDESRRSELVESWFINGSPVVGVVLPLSSNFKLFADGLLEVGLFGKGLKGLINDFATYGFDAGLALGSLTLKYRGVWYDRGYVNSIVLGL
jgi:hypothetical protein